MPRIFISYSRVDRPFIVELAARLRRIYGLDQVWFDESLHGGDLWWQEILSQIARCDIFIYMISRDSIESETCLAELTEARRLRKLVLPVLVRARTPIPPDLSVIQYVDMSAGITVDNLTDLEAAINTLSNNVPSMSPKPLAPEPASLPSVTIGEVKRPSRAPYQKGVVGLGLFIVLLAIVTVLSVLSTSNPSPSETSVAGVNTDSPTQSNADDTTAPTRTRVPPRTRVPTRTATPAPTLTPTPNDEALFDLAWRGVQHNAEWTPMQTRSGVEMMLVPAGCFTMGSTPDEINVILNMEAAFEHDQFKQEQPASKICFDAPFWIDRYEVTTAQFRQYKGVAATRDRPSEPQQPMVTITWLEARDFCQLRHARLPTEAEWEYAARGPDSLMFAWGNEIQESWAVWEAAGAANVGSKPKDVSWVGAYDLSGNVFEWVSTIHQNGEEFLYPYNPDDGREDLKPQDAYRVIRGGGWYRAWVAGRAASRMWIQESQNFPSVGFRCANDFDF
jgi:formylglycine-generating enzyme required for sulfatase activity